MKHTLIAILCLLTTLLLCAQKKEWKQMEDFHTVMSKSYHPVEEGNFQPVKDNIDSLVQKAQTWRASTIPSGYNKKLVKQKLDKLVKNCKAVKEAIVQKKNNGDLKKLITAAHKTFHEIMEKGENKAG
jgi:predicted outer membrane protein